MTIKFSKNIWTLVFIILMSPVYGSDLETHKDSSPKKTESSWIYSKIVAGALAGIGGLAVIACKLHFHSFKDCVNALGLNAKKNAAPNLGAGGLALANPGGEPGGGGDGFGAASGKLIDLSALITDPWPCSVSKEEQELGFALLTKMEKQGTLEEKETSQTHSNQAHHAAHQLLEELKLERGLLEKPKPKIQLTFPLHCDSETRAIALELVENFATYIQSLPQSNLVQVGFIFDPNEGWLRIQNYDPLNHLSEVDIMRGVQARVIPLDELANYVSPEELERLISPEDKVLLQKNALAIPYNKNERILRIKNLFTEMTFDKKIQSLISHTIFTYPSILKLRAFLRKKGVKATNEQIERAWNLSFQKDDSELPRHYLHHDIKTQIAMYHKAYDDALKLYGSAEDIKSKPISGLFGILRSGFAISYDHIQNNTHISPERKKSYFVKLQNLWEVALDKKVILNSTLFQLFNAALAAIVSLSNHRDPYPFHQDHTSAHYEHDKDVFNILLNRDLADLDTINHNIGVFTLDNFKQLVNQKRNGDLEGDLYKDVTESLYIEAPIFVLYGNPDPTTNRLLSPAIFVREFFNKDYRSYLAFFDILSIQSLTIHTKRDPHWSIEGGTLQMLSHDFVHNFEQVHAEYPESLLQSLWNRYETYSKQHKKNEAAVILNGLFIITHEKPNSPSLIFLKKHKEKSFLENMREIMAYQIIKIVNTSDEFYEYGCRYYKEQHRDWESILRDTRDKNGKEFLPLITFDKQGDKEYKRPFPFAYYPNSQELLVVSPQFLEEHPEFKFNSDIKEPKLIYLKKDEQCRIPRSFTNDVVIRSERNKFMIETLKDGYTNFWNYFIELSNEAPEK